MRMTTGRSGDSTLDRVDLIFGAVQEHGYLTLSEVVEYTGIPRSSAHRLLTRMVRMRWLLRVGSNYELGVRLFSLGTEGLRNHWFHRIAYPRLRDLHTRTGYVVHLAYLDGTEAMIWDKLGGGAFGAAVPTRIGTHRPAHQSAVGKVLLAAETDEFIEGIRHLAPSTSRTITDLDQLHGEIVQVRERRFAVDRAESFNGVGCVATPVLAGMADTSDGHPAVAAISICAPVARIDNRLVAPLLAAAAEITRHASPNPMMEHRGGV
ncbi:IclR family transcriptional regulator [Tomitella gaofuii]|uniref:IclR family transcriptional regulator n=1 Tax=Tomitella gaofuii TaxID=2760083 RepID=UPI0015FBB90B|nr:IclR family transcriptional regulator [Tomitella gaofuii]